MIKPYGNLLILALRTILDVGLLAQVDNPMESRQELHQQVGGRGGRNIWEVVVEQFFFLDETFEYNFVVGSYHFGSFSAHLMLVEWKYRLGAQESLHDA